MTASEVAGESGRTSSPQLIAFIDGIGLIGPGLNGWQAGREVLAGATPFTLQKTVLPTPASLPPAERRRCGPIVKLTLAVGYQATEAAQSDPSMLPSVFSASGGDGGNCHELCAMLASDDRLISPTRFHNSVHNAASGYWSIATGARSASSVLCAFDASFGAGLLEAMTQVAVDRTSVLLMVCDTDYPEPLRSARPIPDAFGVAFVLAPKRSTHSLCSIELSIGDQAVQQMEDAALESLRTSIPAARSLPLLQAVASGERARSVIDYLDKTVLIVNVMPCS